MSNIAFYEPLPGYEWAPIEQAPRDGSIAIVYDEKPGEDYGPDVHPAYYDARKRWWVAWATETDPYDIDPTHFLRQACSVEVE